MAALRALLALLATLGSAHYDACPEQDPYSTEPNPFGWPLSPADWSWTRPDCWGKQHLICEGKTQSPLDISVDQLDCVEETRRAGPDGALARLAAYKAAPATSRVRISSYMGTAAAEGDFGALHLLEGNAAAIYEARDVHLAAPSLHTIRGQHYDAELMLLHRPRDSQDMLTSGVIVSVLYRENRTGAASSLFTAMGFANNDESETRLAPVWPAPGALDVASELAPALRGRSYLYNGSVPVPPCTENVKWIVLALPQPVSPRQLAKLKNMISKHTGGVQHRPPHPRSGKDLKCRHIAVNSAEIGGIHENLTCLEATREGNGLLSARCWDTVDPCFNKRYSAVDIDTARIVKFKDSGNVHRGERIVHYKSVKGVLVQPSDFSLDAIVDNIDDYMKQDGYRNFGHLFLNGHIFFARSISVKAVSQHALDGQHFAGELQIEHVMFGDDFGEDAPGYHYSLHKVMVSIFLKLGRENTLLRALNVRKNKISIRDKVPYHLVDVTINLADHLRTALDSTWYWYSSNSTRRGCGSSVRWMVFQEPLEVSLEQLNTLALRVSGVDSSQVPRQVPFGNLWQEQLPEHAVQLNETDCGSLPRVDWQYGESHPHWDHGNERCWATGYPICKTGKRQSPVDVPASALSHQGEDSFLARCNWKPASGLMVSNTGHGLQVNNDLFGYVTVVGEDGFPAYYHVNQFHLHMPSEHMIDGRQYAAELHVVHKLQRFAGQRKGDDLLVVGVMFDIGDESSPLLEQLFLPGADILLSQQGLGPQTPLADGMTVDEVAEEIRAERPIDLMRAMGPALDGPFFRYNGSLTTPPCAEVVKWFVMGTPLTLSKTQWLSFKALYPNPGNNRPVQPLNSRDVVGNSMEDYTQKEFNFFLNREEGRDRFQPNQLNILVPLIGSVLLAVYVMTALFVREDRARAQQSAGGLETVLGKQYSYEALGGHPYTYL